MTIPYNIGNAPFEDYFIRKELFSTGGLWTWGRNDVGQLGTNNDIHRSSPVQLLSSLIWKSCAMGTHNGAAINDKGELWIWGWYCGLGNLGIPELTTHCTYTTPIQQGTVTGWKNLALSYEFGLAIKNDGTLWSWGNNGDGQLGTNDIINKSSPVQTIAGGTNWKTVSCGGVHTAAIKTDGTLWLWGNNEDGELGTNDTINRSSPVQTIAGGTNWKSVSCRFHTAAIKTDGTLWLWGNNEYGELGTNNDIHRSSPVQTIAGGTNWKTVSSGDHHTAAIKTDGTLWGWGVNSEGQLGTNNDIHRSSPVQTIAGGTNWKTVSCGSGYTVAIKTDGTLWLWGYNEYGQLGTNDIINRSSPVQTIAGGTNWKSVSINMRSGILAICDAE